MQGGPNGFWWLKGWEALGLRLAIQAARFFYRGGGDKAAKAYTLAIGCLLDFVFLLLCVVGNNRLPYNRCQLAPSESCRSVLHNRDRITVARDSRRQL